MEKTEKDKLLQHAGVDTQRDYVDTGELLDIIAGLQKELEASHARITGQPISGPIWICGECGYAATFNILANTEIPAKSEAARPTKALDVEEIQPSRPGYDYAIQDLLFECPRCGHKESWGFE